MSKTANVILCVCIAIGTFSSRAFCAVSAEFKQKVDTLTWVAYAPTNMDPDQGEFPTQDSIREDLATLYQYGFRGIVTYGANSSLAEIPRIASETGFTGIIMGIWDLNSQEELMNATLAMRYVDGYCVGNEGLNVRYSLETLNQVMQGLRNSTSKPVTTTEEINDYYNNYTNLTSVGDWIFPNIHPFLYQVKDPKKAAIWLSKHYKLLMKRASPDTIVLVKEAGFPTSGAPRASETNQKEFFLALKETGVRFVYFEAFDQPWKTTLSVEPHWGLFNRHRKPKRFIATLSCSKD